MPLLQLERREVCDEVRFPLMPSGLDLAQLPIRFEVTLFAETLREDNGVVEYEAAVVEDVQNDWQVGDRAEPHGLGSRQVEVLMAGIEWDREQAARSPFQRALISSGHLEQGAAVALEHMNDLV